MKLLKAIRDADALRPNKLSTPRKAEMLMELETRFAEMMGVEAPTLKVNAEDDTASIEDFELLMPDGHCECYCLYLAAALDAYNQDSALYANDYAIANRTVENAMAWWRRNNRKESRGNWKV
nr:MAG TPA: hypothetical protein [Caudoviricetes sp.]